MKELGIDLTKHYSKSFEQLDVKFVVGLNYIITLCAEEVCPTMASITAKKLHWPLPDPAGASEEIKLDAFRVARDEIRRRLVVFGQEHGLRVI